jgi:hypothetical protein
MLCPHCNHQVPDESKFCFECGMSTQATGGMATQLPQSGAKGQPVSAVGDAELKIGSSGLASHPPSEAPADAAVRPIGARPKYICPQCKEQFAKPAQLPRSGFVGRYAPKCPKGHRLVRVLGTYGSFFGWGILVLLTVNLGRLLLLDVIADTRSGLMTAFAILGGLVVLYSVTGAAFLIAGFKARSKEPPMNLLSGASFGGGFGILIAIAICLVNTWYILVRPIDLYQFRPAIGLYAVEGTVTHISKVQDENAFLYDFKESSYLTGETTDNPPTVGNRIWVLGRGYINRGGSITFVEFFRRSAPKGPSANPTDDLVQAIDDHDSAAIQALLDQKIPINSVGRTGIGNRWTPLQVAAWNGDLETLKLLIQRGADVRFKGELGSTALHDARKNPQIVKLLVESGADVNAADLSGNTPLHTATLFPDDAAEIARALIAAGGNVNATNQLGETPMVKLLKAQMACNTTYGLQYSLPVVAVLLQANPDLNLPDKEGRTAQSLARTTHGNCKHLEGIKAAERLSSMLAGKP